MPGGTGTETNLGSASWRVEVKNLREVQRQTEKLVRGLQGPHIWMGMSRATLLVQGEAKRLAPVNTGRLRASILPSVERSHLTLRGVVGTPVSYAAAVEFGRKAGKMPPVEAIERWVHLKRLAVPAGKKYMSKKSREGSERQIAWAIALNIARHGTKPHPYLLPAFENKKDQITQIIGEAVAYVVKSV